jgi:hypothetical protein
MRLVTTLASVLIALAVASPAVAAPKDKIKVNTREFFDPTGAICGDPATAADSDDVTSKWVNKLGVTGGPGDFGLFMQKAVETSKCAAAVADITGFEGNTVLATDRFGYSYRNDKHCGAGAPRISVVVEDSNGNSALYVAGCNSGANPPTTTSSTGVWTTKTWGPDRFNFLGGDIAVPMIGSKITAVAIVFDEGTDTPTGGSIVVAGTAILDKISYNNLIAGGPSAQH